MMTLVIGTPDSGKSLLAEELCLRTGDRERYYLATMQVMDEEGIRRVKKHRKQREGKGFITLERELAPAGAVEEMAHPGEATVLLECVSNLVGNELYKEPLSRNPDEERFAEKIAAEIGQLADSVHHLVVVTNDYPLSDPGYDEPTIKYVSILQAVNRKLRLLADEIYDLTKKNGSGKEERS